MHRPPTRARCSLHLLLVGRDDPRADPAGLLAVLGTGTAVPTVAVWAPDGEPPAPDTLRRAADLLDRVAELTGERPRYVEVDGGLDRVAAQLVAADGRAGGGSIVAVSARAPRRVVRALRRSAASAGAHLALLPPPRHRTTRRVPS